MSDAYHVQTGLWHDYSLDGAEQRQWTLNVVQTGFLLTGIATFIGIVATQFWSILAFIIHTSRSSRGGYDALYHAQQGIIRNNGSPLGVIWSLYKAHCAYSGRGEWYSLRKSSQRYAGRRKRRLLGLIFAALASWSAFRVAAVFSARVTIPSYRGNDVLLAPRYPGFTGFNMADTLSLENVVGFTLSSLTQSLAYVKACYGAGDSPVCKTLPKRKLAYTTAETSACPFGDFCKSPTVIMTTDWLDSHSDLGINAPLEDRVQVRRQDTCAVLDVSTVTNITRAADGGLVHQYWLGHERYAPFTTYAIVRSVYDPIGYSIIVNQVYADGNNSWQPIPEFVVTDGDVNLITIAMGSLQYPSPVDDPLFSIHNATKFGNGTYAADEPAALVACVDRYQLQDPTGELQTPLLGTLQIREAIFGLPLSRKQLATSLRLLVPLAPMRSAIFELGAAGLRAQSYVIGYSSTSPPKDQYRTEMQGWFETVLANLQQSVVEYVAKGYSGVQYTMVTAVNATQPPAAAYLAPPGYEYLEPELLAMASQQKIRNVAGYQSFSVLGVSLIFGVGAFIILLSWIVEPLSRNLARCFGKRGHEADGEDLGFRDEDAIRSRRLRQWQLDSVLHLQRLAYENEHDRWERRYKDVPVTSEILELRGAGGREAYEGVSVRPK